MSDVDLLENLNEPQKAAVLHEGGPMLVLAGAGSGKTRVITHRIAHLVRERNLEPWRVLAVTFTNKASREMRERLGHLLGDKARELTVSTFHSASAMLLRREHEAAGLERSFVIYDDSDQLGLVRRAVREIGVDPAAVNPRELLSRIDTEKNQGRLPDQMVVGQDLKSQVAQRVYRKYQQLLRNANATDFGDLLLLLVDLLKRNGEVRFKYQRRFTHVLVDEFQDTNPVQYQMLRLLAPPASNVVVVGDDDQSIYRWRGAEVDNILGFPKDYEGCKVVKLEQNYRSDQTILEAAHNIISRNRRRMDKKLWSSRAKGEPLDLMISRDERQEAQEIARRIHVIRNQGICDYDEMAVFYRTNAQSRVLEESFRLARVPYTLVSGRSFYDRAEIRDAAAYLRLMVNPKSDADLLRVINVPARGIGDTTVERVTDYAASAGISVYQALEFPERIGTLNQGAVKKLKGVRELLDKLVSFGATAPSATAATDEMLRQTGLVMAHMAEGSDESMTRAENLRELLTATREFDQRRNALAIDASPEVTGEVVADASLVMLPRETTPAPVVTPPPAPAPAPVPAPVAPKVKKAPPKNPNALSFDFGANVEEAPPELVVPEPPPPAVVAPAAPAPPAAPTAPLDAGQGSLEVDAPPLQAFLETVSLVGDADGDAGEGKVSLMTLHAAKGLEFDAVFIAGMEEEIFPHRRATGMEATEEDMAEERRLCYVGFTRARRRLTLSFSQTRTLFGEFKMNPPSRFLSEVPKELFGVIDEPAPMPKPMVPTVRRRGSWHSGDDGPQIDRSYDQSTDFHQGGGSDDDVRGMRVSHSQFGRGVVLEVVGKGPNAKLTVKFDTVGTKTVIARFLAPG